MRIDVVSIFPGMFAAVSEYGITGRACREGLLTLALHDPRDYSGNRQRSVDDRPYGGGPGMVMCASPLAGAIVAAREQNEKAPVVYLSPQGRPLQHADVLRFAAQPGLILLAGRYEGVDERLIDQVVDEEWSIGDYVLSGGELAAMVLIDAVTRQLPGALGDEDSAAEDSFVSGLLDTAHYTRPEDYNGQRVPEVLLSGDHERIRKWRLQQSLGRTWLKRPDLLQKLVLNDEERTLLTAFQQQYLDESGVNDE